MFGFPSPEFNGEDQQTLPVPANFVIDQDQTIRHRFISPDFTQRADPVQLVRVVTEISTAAEARSSKSTSSPAQLSKCSSSPARPAVLTTFQWILPETSTAEPRTVHMYAFTYHVAFDRSLPATSMNVSQFTGSSIFRRPGGGKLAVQRHSSEEDRGHNRNSATSATG
jgi:hypothetical protein